MLQPRVAREAGPLIINGKNALKVFRGDTVLSIARAASQQVFWQEVEARRRYIDLLPLPSVLEAAERNGCAYVIEEYVRGGTAQEAGVEAAALLPKVAQILAPLYDLELVPEEADVALYIERCLQALPGEFLRTNRLMAIAARAQELASSLAGTGIRLTVGHGDLTPGNVIASTDGLVLIDWERTGVRSLLHDVLNLLAWYEIFGGRPALFEAALTEAGQGVLAAVEGVSGGTVDWRTRAAYAVAYVAEKLAIQSMTDLEDPRRSRRRLRRWRPFYERVLAIAGRGSD